MFAVAAAALVHALALGWIGGWFTHRGHWLPEPASRRAADLPAAPRATTRAPTVTTITLVDHVPDQRVELGPDLAVLEASHDDDAADPAHPLPDAEVDVPGRRAARAGGGAPGGPDSWTGRRDRENYRTQIWNHAERNRLPRERTGATRRSPESLARDPDMGFDARAEQRRRARAGSDRPTPGGAPSRDPGGPPGLAGQERWEDEDPVFSGPSGALRARRVRGRTGARGDVLADRGERATEAARRGAASDPTQVASASSETDPAPIEMTAPQSGGDRRGVAGRRPPGGDSRRGRGDGEAATRAAVERDRGAPPVRAQRQNPYFRRMYRRLDRRIAYPRELALGLEQGEVVVRFTLAADGTVSDVVVAKSSGFAAIDRTVVTAVREIAPFGRVPAAVLRGHPAVEVLAPYAFRNPLIR